MSYHNIYLFPDEDDLRRVRSSFSPDNGIPAVRITDGLLVQFQPGDHEFAIRYLTKLADEARKLAQQITEANES